MLKGGQVDFVATSMTRTPERLRDVDFSVIYFVTPHAVIVKKSSGITSVHQLAGRKASSASTSTDGSNLIEAVPTVNIVYVRDYAVAFAALKDGSVDAFPTDESVLRAIVQQDGHPDDYLFLPDFAKSRNVGFALKKTSRVSRRPSTARCSTSRPARRPASSMHGSARIRRSRCNAASRSGPIEASPRPWRAAPQSGDHHVQISLPAATATTQAMRNRNIETAKLACFLNSLTPSFTRVVRRKKTERTKRNIGIAAARKAMILKIIVRCHSSAKGTNCGQTGPAS